MTKLNESSLNKLKAINDRIIFKFVQDTTGNMFHEKTKSGFIIIEKADKQLKTARWCQVYKIGKEVSEEIYPGLYILVENLMWTQHLLFEGEKFWTTTEEKVLAVSDELPIAV